MNIQQSAGPILIVAAPLLASFVLPALGLWRRGLAFPVVLIALAVSFSASIAVAREVLAGGPVQYFMGGWAPPWGIELRIDHLGALMLLLLSVITLLIAIYSKKSIARELPGKEVPFYSVYLLLVAGVMGMVAAADMFNLYVFLEITSLTSYALVSIGGGAAVVSAFRYVILGSVGALFYLLSVGYLYSVTGSLNMADLSEILPDLYRSNAVLVGFAFFVIGMSIKMALFPMHAWLPGAYANAPSAVSALIAATTTKVAAYALIRVMFFVFEPRFAIELIPVTTLLSWMGAIAMVLGSVMAIAQSDLKRMLAYSSVAQIGYIVLGVGLANAEGFTGGVLHLVNHAVMKGCLFLVAGAIVYQTGRRKIRELRQLSVKMPWTTATFTIAAFSMIGIPPFGGFFSKLYLILGAIDAGQWIFVAAILFSSVLALTYLGNVIRHMYFTEENMTVIAEGPEQEEAPLPMLAPMLVLAALIVLLGLFNGEVVSRFIDHAVPVSFVG
jgi:multicomponent Na+:H+ antiporter subunit D